MTPLSTGFEPQKHARLCGVVYLAVILVALFGEMYARGTLIRWGDPALTAERIASAEGFFRLGIAGEVLTCVGDLAVAWLLYLLLRPINSRLALVGLLMRVVFVAVYAVIKLFEIGALVALDDSGAWTGLTTPQLQDLAYVFLRVHSLGYGVSLLFFGVCCSIYGFLIRRSGYIPWGFGLLLEIAGIGYMLFSVAQMLDPSFAAQYLFPWLILPAFPAELGLALWLAIRGVDLAKWRSQLQSTGRVEDPTAPEFSTLP